MKKLSLLFATLLLLTFIHPPAITAASEGDKLISFTSKTIRDETVNLDDIIGNKPVLLFFWASW